MTQPEEICLRKSIPDYRIIISGASDPRFQTFASGETYYKGQPLQLWSAIFSSKSFHRYFSTPTTMKSAISLIALATLSFAVPTFEEGPVLGPVDRITVLYVSLKS
jgi:hypothetical protein